MNTFSPLPTPSPLLSSVKAYALCLISATPLIPLSPCNITLLANLSFLIYPSLHHPAILASVPSLFWPLDLLMTSRRPMANLAIDPSIPSCNLNPQNQFRAPKTPRWQLNQHLNLGATRHSMSCQSRVPELPRLCWRRP